MSNNTIYYKLVPFSVYTVAHDSVCGLSSAMSDDRISLSAEIGLYYAMFGFYFVAIRNVHLPANANQNK